MNAIKNNFILKIKSQQFILKNFITTQKIDINTINTEKKILLLPNKSYYYWNLIKKNKKKIKNYNNNIHNKFITIIDVLNSNTETMKQCYYEICKIKIKYPPQKNENKFIYGKLIEKSLINAFIKCDFNCIDLDKKHKQGSEYKNDITLLNTNFSIKAKLNKGGNIIMINKQSTNKHNIKIETVLCVINEKKLYFIPSTIIKPDTHIIENAGCISYKYSLINMIEKQNKEYVYIFPELTNELKDKLNEIIEIDIYEKLYNDIISV